MTALEATALGAVGWSLLALTASAARAWGRGTVATVAAPAGSAWTGVRYAFGAGMSPRAKESATQHPYIYLAGMLYHAGIFAGLATLFLALTGTAAPRAVTRPLAGMLLLAALAGAALLVRRMQVPLLRAISAPDDYASNVLVDAWLVSAALASLAPATTSPFLVLTIVLGIYAPLGKIRHCVFFFLARGLFGVRIGRRGIVAAARHGGRS